MTGVLLQRIKKHIEDYSGGMGTFEFNGLHIYEYLLNDWQGKQNHVLVVWFRMPAGQMSENDLESGIAFEAESMLELDKARSELKKAASKWSKEA